MLQGHTYGGYNFPVPLLCDDGLLYIYIYIYIYMEGDSHNNCYGRKRNVLPTFSSVILILKINWCVAYFSEEILQLQSKALIICF